MNKINIYVKNILQQKLVFNEQKIKSNKTINNFIKNKNNNKNRKKNKLYTRKNKSNKNKKKKKNNYPPKKRKLRNNELHNSLRSDLSLCGY